jgi:hypothetical protein
MCVCVCVRVYIQCFFLGGGRGTRTPKHFVNLTGESKHFKMLELRVPLNIFFFRKKALIIPYDTWIRASDLDKIFRTTHSTVTEENDILQNPSSECHEYLNSS